MAGNVDPDDPIFNERPTTVLTGGLAIRGAIVQGPHPTRLLIVGGVPLHRPGLRCGLQPGRLETPPCWSAPMTCAAWETHQSE